ncbi:MAG: hypothetical protein RI973_968 [Bacteroidota bacterium]|jgi:hypothetical protein
MKKIFLFSLLSLICCLAFQNDAHAQKRGKKKKSSKTDEYFDDSGFVNKLWYGGGLSLPSFAGGRDYNVFTIGVAPMVGYKVVGDILSVGPRVSLDYLYLKGYAINENNGQVVGPRKLNSMSYSFGAFARAKVFRAIFAHAEFENQHTREVPIAFNLPLYDPVNDEIITNKVVRNNMYLGAGYNSSSGLIGWEIMLLYNVNAPENTIDLPFTLRMGLNYKF